MSRLGKTSFEPPEPYDGKLSCTVLRGKAPEREPTYPIIQCIKMKTNYHFDTFLSATGICNAINI